MDRKSIISKLNDMIQITQDLICEIGQSKEIKPDAAMEMYEDLGVVYMYLRDVTYAINDDGEFDIYREEG